MKILKFIVAYLLFSAYVSGTYALNYHATEHQMTQPDGTKVSVYLYGTEFYIDAESKDHYTLIKDEVTGYICYALLSSNGKEYASTGIVYKGGETPEAVKMIVQPGIRVSKEARDSIIAKTMKTFHRDEIQKSVSLRAATVLPDTVYGVCCLIDFSDTKSSVSIDQIKTFLNADEETVFGNPMSIKKYFQWISGGKLTYINYVPSKFYTAPNTKDYYSPKDATDYTTENFFPVVEKALLSYSKEVDGFDVKDLSTRDGAIMAINILYAGTCENKWGTGLWPHMNYQNFNLSSKGFSRWAWHGYQMSYIGDQLKMATFVHENGHLVCGWPDFYPYDKHEDNNAAKYNVADITYLSETPPIPNPWAMDQLGWLSNKVDITDIKDGRLITLKQEVGSVAVYRGTGISSAEKYYIEIRDRHIAVRPNNDKGIFIWHSNDKGDNNYKDNPELLDCRPATDNNPFWTATTGPGVFSDDSNPSGKWYSGENSGIYLCDFSEYGETMTFRCGPKQEYPDLELVTDTVMPIQRGTACPIVMEATGGLEPYSYEVVKGSLPLGLILNADGSFDGETQRSDAYTFTIRVTSSDGQTVEREYSTYVWDVHEPYFKVPVDIPGVFQGEYFDRGGRGISYWCEECSNEPSAARDDNTIIAMQDLGSSNYAVKLGYGDWVSYTVDAPLDIRECTNAYYSLGYTYSTTNEKVKVALYVDDDFDQIIEFVSFKGANPQDSSGYLHLPLETLFRMADGEHILSFQVITEGAELYLDSVYIDYVYMLSTESEAAESDYLSYDATSRSYTYHGANAWNEIVVYSVDGSFVDRIKSKGALQATFGANYPKGVYIFNVYGENSCRQLKAVKR